MEISHNTWIFFITLVTIVVAKKTTPTIQVVILVRNKAHSLPWFLGHLENLDYPKKKIHLWIRTDHNEDNSQDILEEWIENVRPLYAGVDFASVRGEAEKSYKDSEGPLHWSPQRFKHVIKLKQQALDNARKIKVDSVFFLDADVMFFNKEALTRMMKYPHTIIAPLIRVPGKDKLYANFWGGFDNKTGHYYRRTESYIDILYQNVMGCIKVALVHSAVLINLRNEDSKLLQFSPPPPEYYGPLDDIIVFAHAAKSAGIDIFVENRYVYGLMTQPMEQGAVEDEVYNFVDLLLGTSVTMDVLHRTKYVTYNKVTPKDLGVDKIYSINLVRRPERRQMMIQAFDVLGIKDYVFYDAVDGKTLTQNYLDANGIKQMPGFIEPFHKRNLKMGEIACFLSHYNLWKEIVEKKYERVIILEDDVHFQSFFKPYLYKALRQIERNNYIWDLIYLGRKKEGKDNEYYVEGTTTLMWPDYSYWTVGYMLSQSGAQKLIDANPLNKMVPVDEYLPIMFDKHPNDEWKAHFENRNLEAMSMKDLVLNPTHYVGDEGYYTDTELSEIIADESTTYESPDKKDPACTTTKCKNTTEKTKEEL